MYSVALLRGGPAPGALPSSAPPLPSPLAVGGSCFTMKPASVSVLSCLCTYVSGVIPMQVLASGFCMSCLPGLSILVDSGLTWVCFTVPDCLVSLSQVGLKSQMGYCIKRPLRSHPREGNGTPLQYSCLENPTEGPGTTSSEPLLPS